MVKLALLGGTPIRKRAFENPGTLTKAEEKAVLQVIKNKEQSRFMGSASDDIEKQLNMPSIEAVNYSPQHFMFLGGKKIRKFEADFSKKFNVKYSITVNSATSGLMTALGACGVGPGDEVITTCLSFNATATSILAFNAIPVFADVEQSTYCIDPQEIKKKISAKTKAIIVVHLLGNAANMTEIKKLAHKNNIKIIEDCAQAPGTKYRGKFVGTIGDAGVFSFQETKNISTGEGGMVVTNDKNIARRCRMIRNHGESLPDIKWKKEQLLNIIGFNFRMTELTAAVGIEQLKKLDKNNTLRNKNAHYLYRELNKIHKSLVLPKSIIKSGTVVHLVPMVYDSDKTGVDRAIVVDALRAEGITVGTGYLNLMPENPIFTKKIAYGKAGCPYTCSKYNKKISYSVKDYPIAADLIYNKFIWFYHINRPNTINDMRDVVKAFNKVFNNLTELKKIKNHKKSNKYKW